MANNIDEYSPQEVVVHVAKKVKFVSLFSVVQVNVHLYSINALLYMFQGNKNTISSWPLLVFSWSNWLVNFAPGDHPNILFGL